MIIIYLIILAWVGYAARFAYVRRNDFESKETKWWTPIFMFAVGLWTPVLSIKDGYSSARRTARKMMD